ncbi:HNH endonuclease [Pectobacterium carotovorum]|uniref:HNH endonuclease n=1 Tax=Pectobacterium carotovorum TaxID=554 RepID=UPI003019F75C
MKISVFASLFVEAINNAGEDNGMANTISGMLNQIEQKEVARRSRITEKKRGDGKEGNYPLENHIPRASSHPRKKIVQKNREEDASSVFSRELKQKKYRKLVSERPYYFLSLESLIEKKSEARSTFERAKLKYSGHGNLSRLHQAENKYRRVMTDVEREIQLKVRERLQKGQRIPRSLLVNDGFVLSEEGAKREERRRQLIAEEARAAAAHREAISKFTTYTKLVPQPAVIQTPPPQVHAPVLPKNTLQFPVTEVTEDFDRALYFELLRSMSRDEAWRIVKNKAKNTALQKAPFLTGEFCYIHTLCYWLQISAGVDHTAALNVATNSEKAEGYLRKSIADWTTNCIRMCRAPSIKHRVVLASRLVIPFKFNTLRHFNLIDPSRYLHSISSRSASLQTNFKTRVLENFYHCCAVTGQKIGALLQACHIEDYALGGDMSTDNGILLSADCHRLFDENLMGIEPEKLTIHFKVRCIYSSMFEGKRIHPHRLALNKDKLRKKWEMFQAE